MALPSLCPPVSLWDLTLAKVMQSPVSRNQIPGALSRAEEWRNSGVEAKGQKKRITKGIISMQTY
jgi:hypothetical protein